LLNEWEGIVLSLLKRRIEKLKRKYSNKEKVRHVLRDKVHLKDFQDRYVLASAGNSVKV